jgi:ATP/maltotriose-dependent transcriptional regulator MalT
VADTGVRPAGSGKTALLAAWASGCQWPVAGLSLDEGDNDPARTAVARRALRAP